MDKKTLIALVLVAFLLGIFLTAVYFVSLGRSGFQPDNSNATIATAQKDFKNLKVKFNYPKDYTEEPIAQESDASVGWFYKNAKDGHGISLFFVSETPKAPVITTIKEIENGVKNGDLSAQIFEVGKYKAYCETVMSAEGLLGMDCMIPLNNDGRALVDIINISPWVDDIDKGAKGDQLQIAELEKLSNTVLGSLEITEK